MFNFLWIQQDSCPRSPGDRQRRPNHHQISAIFYYCKVCTVEISILIVQRGEHIQAQAQTVV